MSVLIDLCERRCSILEEFADQWKVDHDDAMFALDIEQLCHEGADLCRLCRTMCDNSRQRLFEGKITDINGIGNVLVNVNNRVLRSCAVFHRHATALSKRGREADFASELEVEMANLAAATKNVLKKWPFIDPGNVARTREEYLRGEYLDSGELLHAKTSQSA